MFALAPTRVDAVGIQRGIIVVSKPALIAMRLDPQPLKLCVGEPCLERTQGKMNKLKSIGLMGFTFAALAACGPELSPEEMELEQASNPLLAPRAPGDDSGGGGAGGSIPATPPAPASSAELTRYYGYLSQAGFYNPSELGMVKEEVLCDVYVSQGAGTFNRGITKTCTWQQTEPGWALQSVSVEVPENKNGRGSYAHSTMAADGQFFMHIQETGDKWKAAIDMAASAADVEVKQKLEFDYQHHMERMVKLSANQNTVHLEVTANGGAFAKSAIRVILRGKKIRVE
jgi:hypothetical protein